MPIEYFTKKKDKSEEMHDFEHACTVKNAQGMILGVGYGKSEKSAFIDLKKRIHKKKRESEKHYNNILKNIKE